MSDISGISIYPVGVLAAWKRRRLRSQYVYLKEQVRARNWRAVRNSFNGYLAEWDYPPEGVKHYRCGHGRTKNRALHDLGKHIAHANHKGEA